MEKVNKIPWDSRAILICTKCGAKFNQAELAEEVKSEIRKEQKKENTLSQNRVMTSSCLGVCYPEKQTIGVITNGEGIELNLVDLDKQQIIDAVNNFIKKN